MKSWTVHVHEAKPAVLVKEGFAWGAFIFGPFWLAVQRAWIPAGLALAAHLLIGFYARDAVGSAIGLLLQWCLGLWGNDLCRWALAMRGYVLAHVVMAPDADSAFLRLMSVRPDLAEFYTADLPHLKGAA